MNEKVILQSRRDFLLFIGGSVALSSSAFNSACTLVNGAKKARNTLGLPPGLAKDDITLAEGLSYEILIKEGDPIGPNLYFGTNNDFIQFVKLKNEKYGLWVNHEAFSSVLASKRLRTQTPSKAQYDAERHLVGGSFFEVTKEKNQTWKVLTESPYNTRLSGHTKIPFNNNEKIANSSFAIGTFANCAGGLTPWNTILTCEENYQDFYGEYYRHAKKGQNIKEDKEGTIKWHLVEPHDPRHYGWVVEFDPETKKSKKLIGLGRFAHECAKTVLNTDGRTVVYSGDDANDECLYKFVARDKNSLDHGELFVASLEQKKWISLDIHKNPILKKHFKNQTEVLTFCREAAKLVGATPLARPEDIEIDPLNGHVFIALTNNKKKNDYFGSILKIKESNNNYASESFEYETFLTGGPNSGLACPDNMVFDRKGHLWITTDISGPSMTKGFYKDFGHNGLFVIPRTGSYAGQVIQVASAPVDAEFTGPCFSPDGKTLFLSVQHPGELSSLNGPYTSHWPEGGTESKPLSAVIAISGVDKFI